MPGVIHTYDPGLPQTKVPHPDWGDWTTDHYGIPYNVVPATQADLKVTFNSYADESDPGPMGWIGTNPVTASASMGTTAYPFFVGMKIEGDPSAGGTPGNLPGDQHALVLQQGASGCKSYEAWNCVAPTGPSFTCANGAVFDLTSNALRPLGWTSGDAAGLSILAGLVRLTEVKAGAITHAIRVTFDSTQGKYIAPATHAASSKGDPVSPDGVEVADEGQRRHVELLGPVADRHGHDEEIRTDRRRHPGRSWYFQGDSDDGWNAMAPDGKDTYIAEILGDFGPHHRSRLRSCLLRRPAVSGERVVSGVLRPGPGPQPTILEVGAGAPTNHSIRSWRRT